MTTSHETTPTAVEDFFQKRAAGAALVAVIFAAATVLMIVREAQTGRGVLLICAAIAAVSCVGAVALTVHRAHTNGW